MNVNLQVDNKDWRPLSQLLNCNDMPQERKVTIIVHQQFCRWDVHLCEEHYGGPFTFHLLKSSRGNGRWAPHLASQLEYGVATLCEYGKGVWHP